MSRSSPDAATDRHGYDIVAPETLIGFRLDRINAQCGPSIVLQMQTASVENGVDVVAICFGKDWATALSKALAEAAAPADATGMASDEDG